MISPVNLVLSFISDMLSLYILRALLRNLNITGIEYISSGNESIKLKNSALLFGSVKSNDSTKAYFVWLDFFI